MKRHIGCPFIRKEGRLGRKDRENEKRGKRQRTDFPCLACTKSWDCTFVILLISTKLSGLHDFQKSNLADSPHLLNSMDKTTVKNYIKMIPRFFCSGPEDFF